MHSRANDLERVCAKCSDPIPNQCFQVLHSFITVMSPSEAYILSA